MRRSSPGPIRNLRSPLTLELATVAARAAGTKTLDATVVIDVGDLFGISDYFVVTSGGNDRQVRAIVDEVTMQVRAAGGRPVRQVEGLGDLAWVLLDYGDFIVHVFSGAARSFYDLERLWQDAQRVPVSEMLAAEGITSEPTGSPAPLQPTVPGQAGAEDAQRRRGGPIVQYSARRAIPPFASSPFGRTTSRYGRLSKTNSTPEMPSPRPVSV